MSSSSAQYRNDDHLIDLIARCAIKDQHSLKQLFTATAPYLNAVAYRIVKSEELSSEILQEAFIQIWRYANTYRSDIARPLTWMTSIVRYRAIDSLEVERKHWGNGRLDEEQDTLESQSSNTDPEKNTAASQLTNHLFECMKGLSDQAKNSIQLAYIYGYSREEIATKLDTNSNTVKSWLRRGSERLKECLETKM